MGQDGWSVHGHQAWFATQHRRLACSQRTAASRSAARNVRQPPVLFSTHAYPLAAHQLVRLSLPGRAAQCDGGAEQQPQ